MDRTGALDELDRKIIHTLRDQPRLQNRALAATVGVSEPTIYARMRELAAAHACEIRAQIDYAALGYRCTAFMDISVQDNDLAEVAEAIAEIDEALFVVRFAGDPRLMAVVASPSEHELLELARERLGRIRGISRIAIHLALHIHRYAWGFAKIGADRHNPLMRVASHAIDDKDFDLVETMRLNPRFSNRQLAAATGISEATVRRRLSGLQEAGTFKFSLVCEPAVLGYSVWRHVRLSIPFGGIRSVIAELVSLPETLSVTETTGIWNVHWFNLFMQDDQFDEVIGRINSMTDRCLDFDARTIDRTIKHNCDYIRIV